MATVFVVGSINLDRVLNVHTCPMPGETVVARQSSTFAGGKGANQAVSAARAGAGVVMIGAVGSDDAGDELIRSLGASGLARLEVQHVPGPTGSAIVMVGDNGENSIVVSQGANAGLEPQHVLRSLGSLNRNDIVVLQAEVPPLVIETAASSAAAVGARVVLNLAPPVALDLASLSIDTLIVNEHEAAALTGLDEPEAMAMRLAQISGGRVVLTLGSQGALIADDQGAEHVSALAPAAVVDTTGAGDAFVGAFAAALASGLNGRDAVRWGAAAGSLTVESVGAQGAQHVSAEAIAERLAGAAR